MKIIGVYGSLKRGCYNHRRYGMEQYPVLATSTIKGAMDLVANSYPRLYPQGTYGEDLEREHVLELYEVPDTLYSSLDMMETSAGYEQHTLEVLAKNEAGDTIPLEVSVWLMNPAFPINKANYIEHYPV